MRTTILLLGGAALLLPTSTRLEAQTRPSFEVPAGNVAWVQPIFLTRADDVPPATFDPMEHAPVPDRGH